MNKDSNLNVKAEKKAIAVKSGVSNVRAASLANLKPWAKGESGNPAGSSKEMYEFRRKAFSYCEMSLEDIHEIAVNRNEATSERLKAYLILLSYGAGRPIQSISVTDDANNKPVYNMTNQELFEAKVDSATNFMKRLESMGMIKILKPINQEETKE